MDGWRKCKLEDVVVLQRGHDLPKTSMNAGIIPVAGSNGIIGYHNEATTKGPGITIGRSGNIGIPKYYEGDYWAHNTVLYAKDFKRNDVKFLYYFLLTFDFSGFNAGSAVPTLNRNHIHEIPVVVPPLSEQHAIAGVLSSLDDKIDLLHRQNKTLEGIASALWRKMFIEDADPGWKKGKLGDIVSFSNGKSRPDEVLNGTVPIYGGNGILGYTDSYNSVDESIIVGRVGAYCGSLYIEHRPIWITDNALLAKPLKKYFSKYLFYLLKNQDLNSMAEGSSHPLLTQTLLNSIDIDMAPDKDIYFFGTLADVWLNKVDCNNQQIRTLSRLRDTLLPKLMSGEVRVRL